LVAFLFFLLLASFASLRFPQASKLILAEAAATVAASAAASAAMAATLLLIPETRGQEMTEHADREKERQRKREREKEGKEERN
jgi:hypothetical protein